MKYHATRLDHVRWRSETLNADISDTPGMGSFIAFQGRDTAILGWHSNDGKTGDGLSIELERSEAEALHRLLGERLGLT